ncbi:MAG: succinate dehydrogenase cytochrome b subunit [Candidatus Sericytochromatia bacterium]
MQNAEKQTAKPNVIDAILSIFDSTVGRKYIMGLSGLALVGFIVFHLAGNLSLFFGEEAFNSYVLKLESLGPLIRLAELGLMAVFVFHIIFAFSVTAQNKAARKTRYAVNGKAGKPSRKTIASQSMIYTGLVLLIFIVAHVWMFRFATRFNPEHVTIHGAEVINLYTPVVAAFKNPWIALAYSAVMLLLGMHVSHGFWSAFQSLGAYHPRYTPVIYTAGVLLALLLAVGFIALPGWVYFMVPVK